MVNILELKKKISVTKLYFILFGSIMYGLGFLIYALDWLNSLGVFAFCFIIASGLTILFGKNEVQ
jgi:hypothetical protein